MLVKHRYGKGYVYTLTLNAYPGHEKFQKFSAAWTEFLCRNAMGEVYVDDPSETVFWTVWEEESGDKTLMLLNTDWTAAGNEKNVTIITPHGNEAVSVKEREALICRISGGREFTSEISRVTL